MRGAQRRPIATTRAASGTVCCVLYPCMCRRRYIRLCQRGLSKVSCWKMHRGAGGCRGRIILEAHSDFAARLLQRAFAPLQSGHGAVVDMDWMANRGGRENDVCSMVNHALLMLALLLVVSFLESCSKCLTLLSCMCAAAELMSWIDSLGPEGPAFATIAIRARHAALWPQRPCPTVPCYVAGKHPSLDANTATVQHPAIP
jgi:hypothetical protein